MISSMNKRQIGLVIIALAVVLFLVTLSLTLYTNSLNKILHQSCNLPAEVCPFNKAVPNQSIIGFTIVALFVILGIYLVLQKEPKLKEVKLAGNVRPKNGRDASNSKPKISPQDLKELKSEEKKILGLVIDEGAIFQAALVEKSGLSKVKVTRILDTLEGKGFIERKRRGMSNVVILKNS